MLICIETKTALCLAQVQQRVAAVTLPVLHSAEEAVSSYTRADTASEGDFWSPASSLLILTPSLNSSFYSAVCLSAILSFLILLLLILPLPLGK